MKAKCGCWCCTPAAKSYTHEAGSSSSPPLDPVDANAPVVHLLTVWQAKSNPDRESMRALCMEAYIHGVTKKRLVVTRFLSESRMSYNKDLNPTCGPCIRIAEELAEQAPKLLW